LIGEYVLDNRRAAVAIQSQPLIFMIQGCTKQVERKEGYELQLVMVMVTASQWHRAILALKSQQPVMIECT